MDTRKFDARLLGLSMMLGVYAQTVDPTLARDGCLRAGPCAHDGRKRRVGKKLYKARKRKSR